MTQNGDGTIVIELNDIQSLFVAPELNLLSNNELEILGQPGMMRVLYRLKPQSLQSQMRLVLLLPPEKIEPHLEEKVQSGIKRFCTLKIEDNNNKLKLLRQMWWRSTLNGVLFLAACIFLANLSGGDWLPFLPPLLKPVLTEGFTIIGWVGLWHPVETLLYDWIPIVRENDVYQLIRAMDIGVSPQS